MTDYGRWDSYVANLALSSDSEGEGTPDAAATEAEDGGEELSYGWGKPLDERGQIDRSGALTVGNAKGNALSTNEAPRKTVPIRDWSWDQTEDSVRVTLDVTRASEACVSDVTRRPDFSQDMVRAKMRPREVEVRCCDKENTWELTFGLEGLPGIDPEASSFAMSATPGDAKGSRPKQSIVLSLAKSDAGRRWDACGRETSFSPCERAKEDAVTITDYSWSDGEQSATVYLKVPGLKPGLGDEAVQVRFRELSFDAKCAVGGKRYSFAVTELPMEIEVTKCSYTVRENELKIRLRKWAKCSWFKLQVHRG